MAKYYLYLTRRNKKGIKLLATFPGKVRPAARIEDVKNLNLSPNMEKSIEQAIYNDRMLWEPWIEGAESFEALKQSLKNRGYKNLPVHLVPELHHKKIKQIPVVNEKTTKTMIRKKNF